MNSIIFHAPAKINLTLDVLGKRSDGYHNVKMLMQTIGVYDKIEVAKTSHGIEIKTNKSYLPVDERNIAHKAASLFLKTTGITGGAKIEITKQIPVSAGLAGGSTDGAAVLKALNVLYELPLSMQKLSEIAVQIGADVPYCLTGGTALSEGIGELLTPLPALPECIIVLAKPPVAISTALVYQRLQLTKLEKHPDTCGAMEALRAYDIKGVAVRLYNVLETVTSQLFPQIDEYKKLLLDAGALGAVMSGSGPSVFGIFDCPSKAMDAVNSLKTMTNDVFLTSPVQMPEYA